MTFDRRINSASDCWITSKMISWPLLNGIDSLYMRIDRQLLSMALN